MIFDKNFFIGLFIGVLIAIVYGMYIKKSYFDTSIDESVFEGKSIQEAIDLFEKMKYDSDAEYQKLTEDIESKTNDPDELDKITLDFTKYNNDLLLKFNQYILKQRRNEENA